nr:hypothetical protein GCM10020185_79480 [Pseudomonas brassicacearum subsp. brassicacearum]
MILRVATSITWTRSESLAQMYSRRLSWDSSRPRGALADRQGLDDFQALHVDQAQAVVFLVGNPGDAGGGGTGGEQRGAQGEGFA